MDKPIDKLVIEIENYIKNVDSLFLRNLDVEYKKLIYNVHADAVRQYSKGYCMRMMIPEKEVLATFSKIDSIPLYKISEAFASQWIVPKEAHMHNNTYYHILLLVHLCAIKFRMDDLAKNSLSLLLFRIWNGRIIGAIKFCDPDTMNYVTSVMMNNKFISKNHNSPFEMLVNHFSPTIWEKYKNSYLGNSTESKRIFEQCYARVKQVFRSNPILNLKSGEKKYASGLQPFYYKAKENNLKISTIKSGSTSSEDYDIDGAFSSSAYDDQISDISNFIVMNHFPKYDEEFLNMLSSEIRGINKQNIVKLVSCIHDLNFNDYIDELLQNIFRRLMGIKKDDICSQTFYTDVILRRIISSKHTQDVVNIKNICDKLLIEIFKNKYEKKFDYEAISDTQKAIYRKLIIYAISYNIRRRICFN
ncbi:MAG: hypothetical protein IPH62_19495 [Ignavibacteriae bacterium]|nr:hypothetical protein [Ignavibacteriota bacterium]